MVDVLVVVTALRARRPRRRGGGLAERGAGGRRAGRRGVRARGWRTSGSASHSRGGLLIGAAADRARRVPHAGRGARRADRARRRLRARRDGGHHAAAAARPRRRPRPGVRGRRELLLADHRRGRDAGAALIALAGPRGALVIVGAALPVLVLARGAALTRLAPGATAAYRAAASAAARPGRAGARSPAAATAARPATPAARRT